MLGADFRDVCRSVSPRDDGKQFGTASYILIVTTTFLVSAGLIVLYSTSNIRGALRYDDPQYFLKRQLVWLVLSIVLAIVAARFNYRRLQEFRNPLAIATLVVLVLVLLLGREIGGSRRWLRLGMLSIQPSELAKLFAVIVLSGWVTHVRDKMHRFREGFAVPIAWLGAAVILIGFEPDFGSMVLTAFVGMLILFCAGTRLVYLAITGVLGSVAFVLALLQDPLRLGRVMAIFQPWKYPDTAYHRAQSLQAFIGSGWLGVGLDQSIQKQLYLPEVHTDFIFAIVGEEFGLLGTMTILILFAVLVGCGIRISLRASDPFGRLLAFGITMMVALQATINMGVVTGCLPTKGLPLPFVSYGGTSLLVSFVCIGILLSIDRHCGRTADREGAGPIQDRLQRP